jgi:hypothetical protein
MFILAIIPRTPNTEELLNSLYTNAGLAGFGLLLTAIIQTGLKQLSLFEALFTLHILFFLGTGASPMGKYSLSILFSWSLHIAAHSLRPTSAGKYHWTRGRVVMGILVQFVSVITFTAWGLYVWADAKHYGNNPQCNDHIKYVIFFFTVRATAPWLRGIWIAGLVLSAVGLMLSFGWRAMELFDTKNVMEEKQAEETNTIECREVAVTPGTQPHAETAEKAWYFDISFTLLLCVAPFLSFINTHESLLSSAIYSTVMLELMVSDRICHIPLTIH